MVVFVDWQGDIEADKSLPSAFSTISLGTTKIPLFKRWRIWLRKLGYGLHFLFELGGSQLIHLRHLVRWCYQSRAWLFLAHWVSLNIYVCIAFWRTHVVGPDICLLPVTIVTKLWYPWVFAVSDDIWTGRATCVQRYSCYSSPYAYSHSWWWALPLCNVEELER